VRPVAELSKDIPPKARKEYERASGACPGRAKPLKQSRDSREGDRDLSPTFMMAHKRSWRTKLAIGIKGPRGTRRLRSFSRAHEHPIARPINPHLKLGCCLFLLTANGFPRQSDVLRKATSLRNDIGRPRICIRESPLKASNDFSRPLLSVNCTQLYDTLEAAGFR
jgi:hypothetical protein